jgi:superfamily I DNA/RNA helicase
MFKNGTAAIRRNQGAAIERCEDTKAHALPYLYQWFTPEALNFLVSMENATLKEKIEWFMAQQTKDGKAKYNFVCSIIERHGIEALASEPSIVVGTINSVKGAEADVVFIFPDISKEAWDTMQRSKCGRDAMDRVFYVGVTRAKDTVYVCHTCGNPTVYHYPKHYIMRGA